jgi:hypothetical protein
VGRLELWRSQRAVQSGQDKLNSDASGHGEGIRYGGVEQAGEVQGTALIAAHLAGHGFPGVFREWCVDFPILATDLIKAAFHSIVQALPSSRPSWATIRPRFATTSP